jgi:hypothetical protein
MFNTNKKVENKRWADYEDDEPLPIIPLEWYDSTKNNTIKKDNKVNKQKNSNKFALLYGDEEEN